MVHESGRPQEEVVLLHRLGMDNAEIPPNVGVYHPSTLQLLVLFISEIGHGTLELKYNLARRQGAGSEDAEFRLPGMVRVTRSVGDFDYSGGIVEFEVSGSVGSKRIDLLLRVRLQVIANGGEC